jgi:hypothetical protein
MGFLESFDRLCAVPNIHSEQTVHSVRFLGYPPESFPVGHRLSRTLGNGGRFQPVAIGPITQATLFVSPLSWWYAYLPQRR